MIEVRIRRESEAKARRLCDWPATDLDNLIATVEAWGIQDETNDISGGFVVDSTAAYFEIVIHDEAGA